MGWIRKIFNPAAKPAHVKGDLTQAVKRGDLAGALHLIDNGADVNEIFDDGRTPLMHAAGCYYTNTFELVSALIDRGANVNATSYFLNKTALAFAVEYGRIEIVQLLIDRGADIHFHIRNDGTVLNIAAERGREHIVRLLLSLDADVTIKNVMRETPLMTAARNKHDAVVNILLVAEKQKSERDMKEAISVSAGPLRKPMPAPKPLKF